MEDSKEYVDILYNALNLFTEEEEMIKVEVLDIDTFVIKKFGVQIKSKNLRLALKLIKDEDDETKYTGILQYYAVGESTIIEIPKSKYLLIKKLFLQLYRKFYNYLITVEKTAKLMYGKDSTWLVRVDKILPLELKCNVTVAQQYFYVLIIRIPDHVITSEKYKTGFYLEHDIKGLYIQLGFRLAYTENALSIDVLAKRNILNINEMLYSYISAHISPSPSWGGVCFGNSGLPGTLITLGEYLHESEDMIEIAFLSFALTLNTFLSKEYTFGSPYIVINSLEMYFYRKIKKEPVELNIVKNMLNISSIAAKNKDSFKLIEYTSSDNTKIKVLKEIKAPLYKNIYNEAYYELRIDEFEDLEGKIEEATKKHTPVIFKYKILPLQVEQNCMIGNFEKLQNSLDEVIIPLKKLI